MSGAQVLLYNFSVSDRTRKIRKYLRKEGIGICVVETADYAQPLGVLAGLPGFVRQNIYNMGEDFKEEMLVMCGFEEKQMEDFLAFFRENDLEPVALKAMLTPVSQNWDSIRLHRELASEHRVITGRENAYTKGK